jgi:hypothetical protein
VKQFPGRLRACEQRSGGILPRGSDDTIPRFDFYLDILQLDILRQTVQAEVSFNLQMGLTIRAALHAPPAENSLGAE